jgi:hypothetical protein
VAISLEHVALGSDEPEWGMWRLCSILKWVLGALVTLTLLGPGANWLSEVVFGRSVPGWQEIIAVNWQWILPIYAIVGGLTWWAWRDERRRRLEQEFLLLKPASRLSPEDLGFQVLQPGQTSSALYPRPYYATYIPRLAVFFYAEVNRHRLNEDDT